MILNIMMWRTFLVTSPSARRIKSNVWHRIIFEVYCHSCRTQETPVGSLQLQCPFKEQSQIKLSFRFFSGLIFVLIQTLVHLIIPTQYPSSPRNTHRLRFLCGLFHDSWVPVCSSLVDQFFCSPLFDVSWNSYFFITWKAILQIQTKMKYVLVLIIIFSRNSHI